LACGSDVTLWSIWYVSLTLAAASIAVMLLLIVRRVVQERLARREERLRAAASAALLAHLDGSASVADALRAAGGRPDIITDLVFQMRELVRGQDVQRLVEVARAVGGFDRTARQLRRRNPPARADAARRLAMFGQDAAPKLEGLLRDRSMGVRIAAAVELTAMGRAPSLDVLGEVMRVGDTAYSDDLRRIFRPAVAGDPERATAMLEDRRTSDAMRLMLLDGLAQAGALKALPEMCAQVENGSHAVRAEALRALATLGHPGAASVIIGAMREPTGGFAPRPPMRLAVSE
jgi:hypothetical protein